MKPDALLTALEAARNRFGPGEAARTAKLLAQLAKHQFSDAHSLLRLHETLLFLRAFPQGPAVVAAVEHLLETFHQRVEALKPSREAFDDFDTSGMAGTVMQDTLPFEVARWLARRIPRNVEIAWEDYFEEPHSERALAATWPRFIPLLEEDADVEANIPWTRWLDGARGRDNELAWLLRRFEQLPLTDRGKAELYDSLRLPIRWRLGNLRLSRTRNWRRPRRIYLRTEPLITRNQVSLARELARPAPKLERLSLRDGHAVMEAIREVMLVRYRELYGTTLGDPRSVVRADLGRGVIVYLWGLPAERRLPLRAYVAGFTLKNGVPINYVEAIGLSEWIEVGFNTFYTFRQGETAWIYAQALRCLCAHTGATCISIYPYQIGLNNDEAIDSGAFWFYRKLGFRPGRSDLVRLTEREERKIAAKPRYKTPPRILKRLAQAHMFYELGGSGIGEWDTFSTRNLALRVNRRMAREFDGDAARLRGDAVKQVSRGLAIDPVRRTPVERQAFQNWSLALALIPDVARWPQQEKKLLCQIIEAKAGRDEMRYLRLTQRHSHLRKELLRLGS